MTSFYAKPRDPLNVVFIVYPNIVLLDLVGPLQVFTHARQNPQSGPAYQTHIVSLDGGRIGTNTVLSIDTEVMADWLDIHTNTPIHTVVIVGGDGAIPACVDPHLVDQVTQLSQRAHRVCSVCSGALILAATGLLDGCRAVTHWEDCDRLAAQFPKVNVEVDPIYIKDGKAWTSAGITAGIDMALAIIEEDLGAPAAIEMARSLVTPMVRLGGQSQFSPELDRKERDAEGRYTALHDWIIRNLHQIMTVEDLASFCGMSPRNFSRHYTATMGTSPAKAVEAIRVSVARDQLSASRKGIKAIAVDCGFQDDERMRRAFLRQIKTTPSQYRAQFSHQ
ncbi:MAG: GlxA family transcriptional regulator [Roseovarius sp.]